MNAKALPAFPTNRGDVFANARDRRIRSTRRVLIAGRLALDGALVNRLAAGYARSENEQCQRSSN